MIDIATETILIQTRHDACARTVDVGLTVPALDDHLS
jgi:hypothetical protein